jgi:hypothetical protein
MLRSRANQRRMILRTKKAVRSPIPVRGRIDSRLVVNHGILNAACPVMEASWRSPMVDTASQVLRKAGREPDHWDRSGNPTRYVSDTLGISRGQLREAWHEVKRRANLGAQDSLVVYEDGRVTDANGDDIGNILDEVTDE